MTSAAIERPSDEAGRLSPRDVIDIAADPLLEPHLRIAVIREGLTRWPDDWELRLSLADLLIDHGDDDGIEEAGQICREAMTSGPRPAAAARLAALALDAGDAERARQLARLAVDGGERSASATLAAALVELGDTERAPGEYLRAYEHNPSEWRLLQAHFELRGLRWVDPTMDVEPEDLYLDPLRRYLLRCAVDDELAPRADEPGAVELGEGFDRVQSWAVAMDLDPARVYAMLVRLGVLCDWDVIGEYHVFDLVAWRVRVQGWVAGADGKLARLGAARLIGVVDAAPEPLIPASEQGDPTPFAGRDEGVEIAILPQLRELPDLERLIARARSELESERLVLFVSFVDSPEPPVVVVIAGGVIKVSKAGKEARQLVDRAAYTRLDRWLVEDSEYVAPPQPGSDDLLSPDEREWLLDELAVLIGRDPEPFARSPLTGLPRLGAGLTVPRVATTITRWLMDHAGLGHLALKIEVRPERPAGEPCTDSHVLGWFRGIEDERCLFGIDPNLMTDMTDLVATMAHEVAHAYRHLHDVMVEDRWVEERLTDVTTVYLGFGVFTTNASYRFEQTGWLEGRQTVTVRRHRQAGYLPAQAMSYLLAVQALVHGADEDRRRQITRGIGTNQRAFFREAVKLEAATGVRQRLGMAAGASSGEPTAPVELVDRADDEAELVDEDPVVDTPAREWPNFKRRSRAWGARGIMFLSVAAPVALGGWLVYGVIGAAVAGSAWAYLAFAHGPRTTTLRCTGCDGAVSAGDDRCRGCAMPLAREVADDADWARAVQELEAEAIRDLLRGRLEG